MTRFTAAITATIVTLAGPSLVAVPCTLAQQPATTRISEQQVRQILDAVQRATERRDANGILSYLAPNATLEITTESALTGSQTLRLSREEYRRYLEEGLSLIETSSSRLSNLKVRIAPNGKAAIATYQITEETTLKDQPYRVSSRTTEATQFEIVQGRVLATRVKSTARLEIRQR